MSDQTPEAAPAADTSGETSIPADAAPVDAPADAPVVPEEPEVQSVSGEVALHQFRVTFQPSLVAVVVDDLDAVKATNNARRALVDISTGDVTVEQL